MENMIVQQLLSSLLQSTIIAAITLIIFRLRYMAGLGLFYVTLVIFEGLYYFMTINFSVEIIPGIVIPLGSPVVFTVILFAILMVYIREGAPETRKAIYTLIFASVIFALLQIVWGIGMEPVDMVGTDSISKLFLQVNTRFLFTGIIVLFIDGFFIIYFYERISQITSRLFLKILFTMAVVLSLHVLLFSAGYFYDIPGFYKILVSEFLSKILPLLVFSVLFWLYLILFEKHVQEELLSATSFTDTFNLLTFRQQYKPVSREKAEMKQLLRDSEKKFRTALNSIGDAVITTDRNSIVTHLNPVAEQLTGWKLQEAKGKPLKNIFHIINEMTRQPVENPVLRVLREGMIIGLANHTVLIGKDGIEMPIADSGAPIKNRNGEITGVVLVFRDQTKEREWIRKIRESEEKYSKAFKTSPDAVNINTMDGLYVDINQGFTKLTGYQRKDVIDKTSSEINIWAIPEDRVKLVENLIKKGYVNNLESQFRCKDGSLKTALMSARIIQLNETPHILSITRDITKRKMDQQKIIESEIRYKALFNNNHAAMMIIDPETGAIVNVNPAACQFYGWTSDELKKKNIAEINQLSGEQVSREMELAKNEKRTRFNFKHKLANGTVRDVEVYSGPIQIEGKKLLFSVIQDVTQRIELENKLKEAHQRLLTTLESMTDGFVSLDADWVFTYINKRGAALFGRKPEDLIGKHIWTEFPEGVGQSFYKNYYKAMETQQVIIMEDYYEPWSRWFENRIIPSPDGLSIFYQDITDRKKAEEELRRVMGRYKALITVSNTGAWEYHRDTDFLWCSPEYFSMLGRDTNNFDFSGKSNLKKTWIDLIHPEDRERAVNHFAEYLETGSVGMYENYFRLKHKDGHYVWILSRGNTLRDEDGKITNLTVGTHIDISEQKQSEEQIKHSNARLEIMHQLDQAILESQTVENMVQSTLDYFINLSTSIRISIALIDDEDTATVYSRGRLEKEIGQAQRVTLKEAFPDLEGMHQGKLIEVRDLTTADIKGAIILRLKKSGILSLFNMPLIANEKLLGSINFGYDHPEGYSNEDIELAKEVARTLAIAIEQKQLHKKLNRYSVELEQRVKDRTRALLTANQELESFAYSVSHDLRAPLRAISGFSDILFENYKDSFDKDALNYFGYIRESAQNMSQLIKDLLKFSRMIQVAGKKENINLNDLLQETIRNLDKEIQEQKAKVILPENYSAIESDYTLLRQIFQNLIQNAITYHKEGVLPVIQLGVTEEKNYLILSVSDNGIGIAKEQHEKIFEVFKRLHKQEEYPGTGIGLALVKKAVSKLRGTISLESTPGKGTIFYVRLPKEINN